MKHETIFIPIKVRERLGNFYYNDEDGYNIWIQPNGAHDGFDINQDQDGFQQYQWLEPLTNRYVFTEDELINLVGEYKTCSDDNIGDIVEFIKKYKSHQ